MLPGLQTRLLPLPVDLDGVQVLSLDVFDTLLFRLVPEPESLFEILGARALQAGLLPMGCTVKGFRKLRQAAAYRAYLAAHTQGRTDPSLAEIYAQLAPAGADPAVLLELELEVEGQYLRVNPQFPPLLESAWRRGLPIVFLSDMYLSAEQVFDLLEGAGCRREWFAFGLVSGEQGCSKRNGGLFQELLRRLPGVSPAGVLHIGDQPESDVQVPAALGMRTLFYQGTRAPASHREVHERIAGANDLGGMAPLRHLALAASPAPVAEALTPALAAAWFRHGVEAMGPFVAAFADWVVADCQREGIGLICPITRDAHLLAPALERAARLRGLELEVGVLHASRQSVFLAGFERVDAQALASWCRTSFEPEALLRRFGQALPEELAAVAHRPLHLCAQVTLASGRTTQEALDAHFQVPALRHQAEAVLGEERQCLLDYLEALLQGQRRVALVDYSQQNTIGKAIATLLGTRPDPPEVLSYITFGGSHPVVEQWLDGLQVRCYLGGPDRNQEALQQLCNHSVLFEEMFYGEEGTTRGYSRQEDGRVAPVLASCAYSPEELEARRACASGVEAFQRLWCQSVPTPASPMHPAPEAILQQLLRLVVFPTQEEARLLGDLWVDHGFGGSSRARACDPSSLPHLEACQNQARLADWAKPTGTAGAMGQPGGTYWPEGLLALHRPAQLIQRQLARMTGPVGEFRVLALCVAALGHRRIAVHGAGAAGREVIEALRWAGLEIVGLADRNPALHGQVLEGLRIGSPQEARAQAPDAALIGSAAYITSIRQDLQALYGPVFPVFSIDQAFS